MPLCQGLLNDRKRVPYGKTLGATALVFLSFDVFYPGARQISSLGQWSEIRVKPWATWAIVTVFVISWNTFCHHHPHPRTDSAPRSSQNLLAPSLYHHHHFHCQLDRNQNQMLEQSMCFPFRQRSILFDVFLQLTCLVPARLLPFSFLSSLSAAALSLCIPSSKVSLWRRRWCLVLGPSDVVSDNSVDEPSPAAEIHPIIISFFHHPKKAPLWLGNLSNTAIKIKFHY